jgi:diguanylate cyclase (GGDEF)-like protein
MKLSMNWLKGDTHQSLSRGALLAMSAPLAIVTVGACLAVLSDERSTATAIAAAGLMVAYLLALVLAFSLPKRLLQPIRAIAEASRALESGDLSKRATVFADDELGRLAKLFNRMADRLDRRDRAAGRLHELSQLLQTATDSSEAIAIFERLTPVVLPGASGALYLISPSRDDLELRSSFGPHESTHPQQTAPTDCWALRQGHSYLVSDVDRKLVCEHLGGRRGLRDPHVCLPLVTQGEALGLIHASFAPESLAEVPLERRAEELEAIATTIALALANLSLRERLKSQSVRDGLTGLYNRRFLEESLPREIERCRRRNQPLTIVMADLDHFKKLNDTWGHEAGDLAIQSFAEAARRHFRSEDLLCRYGGEEFCFVLPECSVEDARNRAEALLAAQRETMVRFGRDSIGPVTTSIGLASFPAQATDGGALVRLADAALYRAKLEGRNRLVIHEESNAA